MKRNLFVCISAVLLVFFTMQNVYAVSCVRYVKDQKPGGYTWDKLYPLKNSSGPTSTKVSWIVAKDLWERLWVEKRGSDPKKNSVFVIDSSCGSYGHVGIVTKVNSSKNITVRHANWETSGGIATGTYTRSSTSTNQWQYTTSKGVKWSKKYKIYGFVYKP